MKQPPPSNDKTIYVNPISKYLQREGNMRADLKLNQHKELREKDKKDLYKDWRTQVNIDEKYDDHRDGLLKNWTISKHVGWTYGNN